MSDKYNANSKAREARYYQRNAEKNLVRVAVWVPESYREKLHAQAAKWRAAVDKQT